jgi:glycosyltransferase involved in cell wall biosynthesis
MVSTAHAIISGKKSLSFRSDKIIAVSDTVRKMLVNDFNVSNDKVHVIRNIPRTLRIPSVIEQDIFKKNNQISDGDFIVAGIGRLHQEKGFDIFLKALKKVKHLKKVRAILAGKGEEKTVLQNYSNEHNLNIMFAGETNDVELIYSIADIIVIPSRQESAGLVAIEAGLFHKPVIATNVGGLNETIADGFTGLLVPPESPDAISGAIEILYHKRELSEQLGKQLFSYIHKEYNVNNLVDQIESLYVQLISTDGISKNS